MLEELISKPRVIKSYYYYPKLILTINIAEYLYSQGKDVCIFNFDKINWQYYPYQINFVMKCNENSENLVFEAEDEAEVPLKFLLVTSIKNLKLGLPISEIQRVDQNLYKINIDGQIRLFRIIEGKIVEEKIKGLADEILELLKEYKELSLKEIVDIVSNKAMSSRENVRKEVYFLKEIGVVEIKDGKVSLNNYSRLKR